ncbi:conjugal transfer protein TraC [Pedobacter ginsenosidimutans]|uniref:Conjugal transfer protein TraC n=1 Tax=Pedobacter ginsenosidimutans TaxID=687842 RepID=A0A0T5VV87_9SPHI|nr:zincin-like metallopeptidase domain-containing protein [Pedobacter ginsenosidimutans]KRT17728.1 conjugal transfer protein TraC [Pedobacter ginsenosidimutans]
MNKKEVTKPMHVQVAERVIEALKAGTAPWQIPWDAGGVPFVLPYNLQSGKRYRGINSLSLLMSGREDPRWMTYKQAEESGFQVRKGEKSMMIQFVKTSDERTKRDASGKVLHDELGKPITEKMQLSHAIVCNAYVFNADQIDGIPKLELEKPGGLWQPLERAENLISSSRAIINHVNSGNAFYDPSKDAITVPHKDWFSGGDKYYATLLHELGHWTGHKDRLNRDMGNGFGSESYAREELKAEIASMLLGQEIGIGHDPGQHYAYVESWISILENNPFEIFSASMDAERIFGYVTNLEKVREVSSEENELAALKATPLKTVNYLTTGDKIQYNGSVYEVLGHLKQGRLKMLESLNGNAFTLSHQDKLYSALSFLKTQMGKEESQREGQSLLARSDDHSTEINR